MNTHVLALFRISHLPYDFNCRDIIVLRHVEFNWEKGKSKLKSVSLPPIYKKLHVLTDWVY